MVIIAREFMVSGLRMVAASQHVVIAASQWGKVKTMVQVVAIAALISTIRRTRSRRRSSRWRWRSRLVQGIDYFIESRDVLRAPA